MNFYVKTRHIFACAAIDVGLQAIKYILVVVRMKLCAFRSRCLILSARFETRMNSFPREPILKQRAKTFLKLARKRLRCRVLRVSFCIEQRKSVREEECLTK